MITEIYPVYIEEQLKRLDEMIAEIYEEELPKENSAKIMNYEDLERIKRIIYERTKPLVDEKIRLITNNPAKYIVRKEVD